MCEGSVMQHLICIVYVDSYLIHEANILMSLSHQPLDLVLQTSFCGISLLPFFNRGDGSR